MIQYRFIACSGFSTTDVEGMIAAKTVFMSEFRINIDNRVGLRYYL